MNKQFAVIGLGRFGSAVATELANAGFEVTAIDVDEEKVQQLADTVTFAACADVTKAGVCESLGFKNLDVAIVGMSGRMEDSILATIRAKEAGVPIVIAKAFSEIHGTILKKVGADRIVFPERDSGRMLAKSVASGFYSSFFSLSDSFSLVEFEVPEDWVGKNLTELNPRKKLGINVIGLLEDGKARINIDPAEPMKAGWTLAAVGDNKALERIAPLQTRKSDRF